MKNIFKKIKYISLIGFFLFALLSFTEYVYAALIPTFHNTQYTVVDPRAPKVNLSISPSSVSNADPNPATPTLTWNTTNNPDSCIASGSGLLGPGWTGQTGTWTGSKPSSGTEVVGIPFVVYTYTYTLACSNVYGTGSSTVSFNLTAGNIAPFVDAGADQTVTQPTQASSLTGTASDYDGSIASSKWTLVSGPSVVNIVSPNSLSTSVTGMINVGVYTFQLSATDNGGATSSDTMTITVKSGSGPTGTISVTPCASPIPVGSSSCSGSVSWTTANLTTNPTSITRNPGSPFTPSPLSSGSKAVTLGGGTTNFYLYHNSVLLAQGSTNTSCALGSTWNGSICASNAPTTYKITSTAGAGGTIFPSGNTFVNAGADQSFTITPNAGYDIESLTADGFAQSVSSSYTFSNVTATHLINATFIKSAPVVVNGTCTVPNIHYKCATGTSTTNMSDAKIWKWTCKGSDAVASVPAGPGGVPAAIAGAPAGSSENCSQNKPIFNEN